MRLFNHIDRIRWWGGRKEDTVENDFHILKFDKEENELIEDLQEELDDTISTESKRFRST